MIYINMYKQIIKSYTNLYNGNGNGTHAGLAACPVEGGGVCGASAPACVDQRLLLAATYLPYVWRHSPFEKLSSDAIHARVS